MRALPRARRRQGACQTPPLKTLRVADSVRGLAGRTRQSAGEIEGTIDQLLQVTTQVVDEVQSGLVLIEDSLHLSHWNNPR